MSLSHYTDPELMVLLREGKEPAFAEIYQRYWKKLFAVAANRTQDLYVAEELVQDIFSDLWARRETLELTSHLHSYLAVAMKYRIINYKAKCRRGREFREQATKAQSELDDTTLEWLSFQELKERLAKLVADLPARCQLTFQLSREQGLSQKEIAKEMNITEKAVERNIGRALKALKTGLNDYLSILLL